MRVDTKKEANRTGRKKQKRNNSKKIKQLKGHERGCTKTIKKKNNNFRSNEANGKKR